MNVGLATNHSCGRAAVSSQPRLEAPRVRPSRLVHGRKPAQPLSSFPLAALRISRGSDRSCRASRVEPRGGAAFIKCFDHQAPNTHLEAPDFLSGGAAGLTKEDGAFSLTFNANNCSHLSPIVDHATRTNPRGASRRGRAPWKFVTPAGTEGRASACFFSGAN